MKPGYAGATGFTAKHLPPGEQREEILSLIRLGVRFRAQHDGRKPGTLSRLVAKAVSGTGGACTFAALIDELERCAARRALRGALESPVEKVDRIFEVLTYHDSKKGRSQVEFTTLRNHLTQAKKKQRQKFTVSGNQ